MLKMCNNLELIIINDAVISDPTRGRKRSLTVLVTTLGYQKIFERILKYAVCLKMVFYHFIIILL